MSKDSVIRLLVIGDSLDEAEHLTAQIRGAGFAARTTRVEDADELTEALQRHPFDVAVHMLSALDLTLEQTVHHVAEHSGTLPVLAAGAGEMTTAGAMRAGAVDRATPDDDEHLRRVVIREFENARIRRRAQDLEAAYRESEQRARALMQTSRDAIAYIHAGMHVLANDAYLSRFGYSNHDELDGQPMMDMVASDDQAKLKEFLRNYSASEDAVGNLTLRLCRTGGENFEAEVEFSRASIEGEACSQIIIRDPGNAAELERQLSQLSQRDAVTGLYNRQHFMKLLDRALTQAEQDDRESALLQLQIDDFAGVRKQVGVLGADKVIASVAEALSSLCAEDDALARLDGATYAVLTPRAEMDALEGLAEGIREKVKDHICDIDGASITVTLSIGIARIDGSTTDPNDILSRADRALADAVAAGPNAQRTYKPRAGELSQKQIDQQWVATIRDILKQDRLHLQYQPIVSLSGDTTARYEVQVQVLDDQGNVTDDQEMLAAAERTGMSKGVDRWVILNALRRLVEERARQPQTVFFIPLSGHAFDDTSLFRWIHDRVKQMELDPGALVFQADAGAAAVRLKKAAAFGTALHKIGCHLALSDFGHGSEPFQILRHVQADVLRLNEAFMDGLATNTQNQDALREIASAARDQGRMTICPAVADAASLSVIWSLGTDMIQGEFLQEPSTELEYDFSTMSI